MSKGNDKRVTKAKILIVEDESIVAEDIKDILKGLGYTVLAIASSGKQAIKEVSEKHPDLVLMDIVLKGEMDGVEAAEQIRAHFNIPVVYLTAYADEKILKRAKITEPYGYVLKPFGERELYTAIEIAIYKHRIEMNLKENEQWLNTTLKSIGDAVIATDANRCIKFMNPITEALTRWKQEDALGKDLKKVFNIINDQTRTLTDSPITRVFQEGVIVGLESHILIARDGTEIAISDSAAPIKDDKGNIIGAVLVFKDVTERRQADETLRKSEGKLNAMLQSIGDHMSMLDKDLNIIWANETAKKVFGNDVVGRKCYEVFHKRKEPCEPYPCLTLKAFQDGKVHEHETQVIDNDGKIMYFHCTANVALRDEDGNPTAVIEISRDITERKQVEEKLKTASDEWRTTFDSATDLIMLLDNEMKIIKANLATAKFLQKPINEILGKTCFKLIYGTDEPCDKSPLEKMKKTKKHEEAEFYLSERDIWLRISVDPVFDDKGNLTGAVLIIRDITQRKKAEEKILAYQEQLRSLASQLSLIEERERRRIAIDLHDHISQTLAVSKIKLGILRGSTPANLIKSLDEIRDLIEQTIQYTRSLTFELSPPVLYELGFEAAIEWLGEQILKRHNIIFQFEDDEQPRPMEDKVRVILFQAVRELLINITKHAQARNAKVSILREGDNIRVNVVDDGVGFDNSQISLYSDISVGFGLFNIRERLNHIGGQLEVESRPGHGTRVTMLAPLKSENKTGK